MDDQPTADDLKSIALLSSLSSELLEVLATRFEVEEFAAGRRIVTEGQAGYAFYVLHTGSASVTRDGEELRTLAVGDFFGEIAILADGRRTATVTALEPVIVWVLFGTAFRALELERPDVAAAVQDVMRDRLTTG